MTLVDLFVIMSHWETTEPAEVMLNGLPPETASSSSSVSSTGSQSKCSTIVTSPFSARAESLPDTLFGKGPLPATAVAGREFYLHRWISDDVDAVVN